MNDIDEKIEYSDVKNNFIWFSERDLILENDYMNKTLSRIYNFLQNLENYDEKYIFWECLDEYEPPAFIGNKIFYRLNEQLKKNGKYLYFLFGSPNQKIYNQCNWLNTNIDYINFPTSSLFRTNQQIDYHDYKNEKIKFDYFLKCFNKRPHLHRCIMIDYLSKYNLIDNNLISWNELNYEFDFEYFKQKKIVVDLKDNQDFTYHYFNNNFKCLFDIVTESNDKFLFFSEKTWVSIYNQNTISVFYGSQHQNLYLEKLGFKLYHELLDYSFDKEENQNKRCDMMLKQIKEYENKDKLLVYDKIKKISEFNRHRFFEIYNNNLYIPKFFIEMVYDNYDEIISHPYTHGQSMQIIKGIYKNK